MLRILLLGWLAAVALAADPTPRVTLNHFYLTVDPETYQAIAAEPLLRQQWAPFEARTTVRRDSTYTGIYFYGLDTYFEFFAASPERPEGSTGIALALEQPGTSPWLRERWQKVGGASTTMITRRLGDADLDWFSSTSLDAEKPTDIFRLWAMEYAPSFLDRWHGQAPPAASGSILRRDVLARYAHVTQQAPLRAQQLLANVRSIEVALEPAARTQARQLLAAAGYFVTTSDKRDTCEGPDVTIILVPKNDRRGILRVEFTLTREVDAPKEIRMGPRSILFLERGRRASWIF